MNALRTIETPTPKESESSKIIYKTRFRKCDLARALDNKYRTNLVSPTGKMYSVAMRKYFFSFPDLVKELDWSRLDYTSWRGNIDPGKAVIICRHFELALDDFK